MTIQYSAARKLFTFLSLIVTIAFLQPAFSQQVKKKHHHKKPAVETIAPPAFKFKTIIIDPGHGGKDPGAHGVYSKEKTVTLAIAKKLRTALNEQMPALNTVLT